MKVLFRAFIVLAMIFSVAACDEKTVYEPEDDSQWAPVVDPEDEEDQKEDQKEDGKDEGKEEDTPQKKDTIKVMSFNIRTGTSDKGTPNAWDNRKPGVYEMIKTEKPLIVGLQECHIFQRDDITSNCPDYAGFGIGRDNASETSGESCSVIYNKNLCSIEKWGSFWLSPTPDKVSIGWDAAYNRIATWAVVKVKASDKKFFFINTHLDHEGKTAQEESMKLIMKKFAELNTEKLPQVLVADFNQVQNNPIFKVCLETMVNARLKAKKTDSKATYNNWGTKAQVIDHIFVSGFDIPQFKTVNQEWAGIIYISDHFPIYTLLAF